MKTKVSLGSYGGLLRHHEELRRQVPSFVKRYPDTCGQGLRPDANPCWRHCLHVCSLAYGSSHKRRHKRGCFGNRELRIGKLLFGDHSSKSLHRSIWSNDQLPKQPFLFSCTQISKFQLFGINNNGTSSNHNLPNWWVAKKLMTSYIICKVWGSSKRISPKLFGILGSKFQR